MYRQRQGHLSHSQQASSGVSRFLKGKSILEKRPERKERQILMRVIDSSGWIEYFLNGPVAERYAHFLERPQEIITPTIVLYEVYKKVKKESDQEWALEAAEQMERTQVADLSSAIAYEAADWSLSEGLAMADAIVYTTARFYKAELVTSDIDFKGLPGVRFISSKE